LQDPAQLAGLSRTAVSAGCLRAIVANTRARSAKVLHGAAGMAQSFGNPYFPPRCPFQEPPMSNRRTVIKSIGAAAGLSALPWSARVLAQGPVKAGFLYVSPIGDAGWTFQHDQGRKEMEKALAGKVTTKVVDNVPEGADAERVIREF